MTRKPVTQSDLDDLRNSFEVVLGDLHDLTERAESSGVECSSPMRHIVSLMALSESAAALSKGIAWRCALDEENQQIERALRKMRTLKSAI